MQTLEDRNKPAIDKILSIIDSSYGEQVDSVPSPQMVKDAIREANDGGNNTGKRSITWKAGVTEHVVTWILHQGRIVEIIEQSVKSGAVRILRERKILAAS